MDGCIRRFILASIAQAESQQALNGDTQETRHGSPVLADSVDAPSISSAKDVSNGRQLDLANLNSPPALRADIVMEARERSPTVSYVSKEEMALRAHEEQSELEQSELEQLELEKIELEQIELEQIELEQIELEQLELEQLELEFLEQERRLEESSQDDHLVISTGTRKKRTTSPQVATESDREQVLSVKQEKSEEPYMRSPRQETASRSPAALQRPHVTRKGKRSVVASSDSGSDTGSADSSDWDLGLRPTAASSSTAVGHPNSSSRSRKMSLASCDSHNGITLRRTLLDHKPETSDATHREQVPIQPRQPHSTRRKDSIKHRKSPKPFTTVLDRSTERNVNFFVDSLFGRASRASEKLYQLHGNQEKRRVDALELLKQRREEKMQEKPIIDNHELLKQMQIREGKKRARSDLDPNDPSLIQRSGQRMDVVEGIAKEAQNKNEPGGSGRAEAMRRLKNRRKGVHEADQPDQANEGPSSNTMSSLTTPLNVPADDDQRKQSLTPERVKANLHISGQLAYNNNQEAEHQKEAHDMAMTQDIQVDSHGTSSDLPLGKTLQEASDDPDEIDEVDEENSADIANYLLVPKKKTHSKEGDDRAQYQDVVQEDQKTASRSQSPEPPEGPVPVPDDFEIEYTGLPEMNNGLDSSAVQNGNSSYADYDGNSDVEFILQPSPSKGKKGKKRTTDVNRECVSLSATSHPARATPESHTMSEGTVPAVDHPVLRGVSPPTSLAQEDPYYGKLLPNTSTDVIISTDGEPSGTGLRSLAAVSPYSAATGRTASSSIPDSLHEDVESCQSIHHDVRFPDGDYESIGLVEEILNPTSNIANLEDSAVRRQLVVSETPEQPGEIDDLSFTGRPPSVSIADRPETVYSPQNATSALEIAPSYSMSDSTANLFQTGMPSISRSTQAVQARIPFSADQAVASSSRTMENSTGDLLPASSRARSSRSRRRSKKHKQVKPAKAPRLDDVFDSDEDFIDAVKRHCMRLNPSARLNVTSSGVSNKIVMNCIFPGCQYGYRGQNLRNGNKVLSGVQVKVVCNPYIYIMLLG